ncbi:hypothetical protein BBP00_00008329 [Phytophthora kernoviae]|uniref:[histone H3]-trimethyl-L-lysine(4) demethylase n=1 Tax=Phytophthora kernoviae TaxID=325452 RepID=A0A3F2RFM3_9STRA|nr:hypothetical protein BBP00_00008329 [Phytophthora kernoviae]
MDWDPNATDTDGYICPPCPVFYPTTEEFQHPLKYISSIRHIGMQAGICKIVPPKGWRPPFAINEKTFRFRTRVQQLNCIEGHSRAEGNFVEALRLFLYRRGEPMKELPCANGQLVNLHLLYKTVVSLGGYNAVCASDRWEQIVRRVGRTKAASDPSEELCETYKEHYKTCLLAYEQEQETKENSINDTPKTKQNSEDVQATPSGTSASGDIKATPSSKPRSITGKKRPDSAADQDEDDKVKTEEEGMRVKRTLFSEGEHTSGEENDSHSTSLQKSEKQEKDYKRKIRQRDLEPEALEPSSNRKVRLGPPEINVGQKFYRFLPETGAVLAEVKRVFGGKKPHIVVRYIEDGSNDDIDLSTMEILIANGWDANAAELAYNSEICQVCLRGDCWDRMLLCDGCNSGQHLFCLDEPMAKVPSGDWYCKDCVGDAANPDKSKTNPNFGFDMGAEISLLDYKECADAWKRNYFSLTPDTDPEAAITDRELESEYWRLLSIPVHEQRLEVQYGSDVDTGANGSAFPRLDLYRKNVRCVTKRWKNLTSKAKSEYVRQLSEFFSHGLREGLSAAAGGENLNPDSAGSLEDLVSRYAQDDWNLNNMPKLPGSVLQYLDEDIKGVMVPWLYAGMCFSTFCWHVEDHNFYSTSYLHCGAPKTWYGIPSGSAELFERTMRKLTPELFGSQPDLHMQLVTMFSPKTLRELGVPVYRATHRPNEFMVTFPSAYHGGFNNGFNCAEAVNFATVDWLPWGARSLRKYREFHKLPVFCHEALVCTLAETLVDGSTFDFELTESYLLPAVQQLLEDYCEFERRIGDSNTELGAVKRELMADFEKHQFRGDQAAIKPSVQDLKRLLSCGKAYGGADLNRLDTLEAAISDAEHWAVRAEGLLNSLGQERTDGICLRIGDFESLLEGADTLAIEPAVVVHIREVVLEWRAARVTGAEVLESIKDIQHYEGITKGQSSTASGDISSVIQSMGVPSTLRQDNSRYGRLNETITDVSDRLRAKKESDSQDSMISQLERAHGYLELVCEVNKLAAAIVEKTCGFVAADSSILMQTDVERVLEQVDALALGRPCTIANAEAIRQLLEATDMETLEANEALDDRSKSTEELEHLYYLDKKLLRRECFGRRPALARVESFLTQMQTQLIASPPGARELVAYVNAVKQVRSDVDSFVRNFASQEFSAAAFASLDYGKTQEHAVMQLMERVTDLEVGLEAALSQLGAVHWYLRACQLVLGPCDRPPRYSHLVALLQDVKTQEPGFAFPRQEYRSMQLTIADRVDKAATWLRAAKTLEVEEWNVEKAYRLLRESEELSVYLELPVTEMELVQNIVASHDHEASGAGDEEEEEEEEEEVITYEEEPDSPSAVAWKKQRRW